MPKQKKSEKYAQEQSQLKEKLLEILCLDENLSFTLAELDANKDKQDQIMNMLPELRKYFSLSNVTNILSPQVAVRPWISIIKHVLKDDYDIFKKPEAVNGKFTCRYLFRKKLLKD